MIADVQLRVLDIDSDEMKELFAVASKRDPLSRREQIESNCFRTPNRKRDYLAGRLLGKRVISDGLRSDSFREIEILSRDSNGRPTRPRVFVSGKKANLQISISHGSNSIMVAVTNRTDCRIGSDLEKTVELGSGFREMWFSESEQARFQIESSQDATVFWTCKEAAFKAMNRGETFMPRRFSVTLDSDFQGRCRYDEVETLVSESPRECELHVDKQRDRVAVIALARIQNEKRLAGIFRGIDSVNAK